MKETLDIQLGGSANTGRQTDDVMLSTEVARYRKIKEREYQALYEAGDLSALIQAMTERQQLYFAADCVEHALEQVEIDSPLLVMAFDLMHSLRQYADGALSLVQLKTYRAVYSEAYWAVYRETYRAVYSEAYWATYSAVHWTEYWTVYGSAERQWQLDRAMWYLTSVEAIER